MVNMAPPAKYRRKKWLTGLLCSLAALNTLAQNKPAAVSDRISTRLIALPQLGDDHSALWASDPSLRLEQQRLRQSILHRLQSLGQHENLTQLISFIEGLPVTGRLHPLLPDTAALLATPAADYALTPNSTVVQQTVAQRIAVLGANGELCHFDTETSLPVEHLFSVCPSLSLSDEAWVVQHDGVVFQVFTQPWNRFSATLVAPGAWVWHAPQLLKSDPTLSADIAKFLSTQAVPAAHVSSLAFSAAAKSPEAVGYRSEPAPLGWKPMLSANAWGETGLLQTPTARTGVLGSIRFTASRTYPYTRTNVFLQPTGWLELGFRYTDIATRLYGPKIAGEQTYKDKSFDFKAVLNQESAYLPQFALGMRDIGGTGLFSSEYLVASKRTESLDWSLGIGWGNLAGGSTMANPLGEIAPSLRQRNFEFSGQGGTISGAGMFAGNAALFGGVQWTSPSGSHTLKLEWDGNNYTKEPFGQDHGATSPINFGWVYRIAPSVDLSLALERGNKLAFSISMNGNLRTLAYPKIFDTPPPSQQQLATARIANTQPSSLQLEATSRIAAGMEPLTSEVGPDLESRLHSTIQMQTGWRLTALDKHSNEWHLSLETDDAVYASERLEKLFAVVSTSLPADGAVVHLHLSNFGLELRSVRLDRAEWLATQVYPDLPALQLEPMAWQRPGPATQTSHAAEEALPLTKHSNSAPLNSRLETGWGPTFSHILGGPNRFLLYQAGVRAYGQYRFDDNTWAFGQANFRMLDNYDNFVFDGPSKLPRVRTNQRSYVTTSRATIPVAQLTRTFDMGRGHYASAYGGLLEPMYAGVGGEWLWRPWDASWAVGVDVNQVQQRAFAQDLNLRDYRTTTGHATLYWNTGIQGVLAKVSAGKYLAKDVGVTVDLSRSFANGTSMGVWATKTNVSAEQFGEGSFDKGIYINIPFDALLPKSTPSSAAFVWSPLTRDGGARLGRQFALYDLTRHADRTNWRYRSASERRNSAEQSGESPSLLGVLFPPRGGSPGLGDSLNLGSGLATTGVNYQVLLAGAGAVALTMAADQSIADALGPSKSTSANAGQALGSIPYLLAAGAGTAALGTWGEDARTTAYAAISAATWALGTNLLVKSAVGRARPDEGHGAWQFSGPSSSSNQSSFASNHVAAAMALATPFAQRYDMPWLYGVASLTAVGRIQANEHWASDTVAAALLGYAFGTLALEEQHKRRGWTVQATPTQVNAIMRY